MPGSRQNLPGCVRDFSQMGRKSVGCHLVGRWKGVLRDGSVVKHWRFLQGTQVQFPAPTRGSSQLMHIQACLRVHTTHIKQCKRMGARVPELGDAEWAEPIVLEVLGRQGRQNGERLWQQ